jgi:3-oxosteroid 1-dehydrogenase
MSDRDKRNPPLQLSRRSLLKGVGLGAAASVIGPSAGVVPFAMAKAAAAGWDLETDVVVVGSGAGASSAALFAKRSGAEVIMLEKASITGGTTAKSAAVMWIPNNSTMRKNGLEDPKEDAIKYMIRLSYPAKYDPAGERYGASELEYGLIETYYDNAADTIDELVALGALETVPWYTWEGKFFYDYYHDLPEQKAPRGRTLVPKYPDPDKHWHPKNGGNGAELVRQLRVALDAHEIPILTKHRVERVVTNGDGEIVGVEASLRKGGTVSIRGRRAVVFATGGFTHNKEYRENYLRGPIFGGCAVPTNEGDFIKIGSAVGAALGNLTHAWWVQHTLELALEFSSTPTGIWATPGDSMVQVNKYGRRFMNEKFLYNERTQLHFVWDPLNAEYPNLISFMIFDKPCLENFAGLHPLPAEGTALPDYILQADTLDGLTRQIETRLAGLSTKIGGFKLAGQFSENLTDTFERFNEMSRAGKDLDYGRGEMKIERDFHLYGATKVPETEYPNLMLKPLTGIGPYYCILLCAGTLDTKGGPRVNPAMQVMNAYGEVIPGLYAAGNCTAHPAGQAYWSGGGTIGPALTMGRTAGLNAAKEPPKKLT